MEPDKKTESEMKGRKTKMIIAVAIICVLVLGILGWLVFYRNGGDDANVPSFQLGEEWWFSLEVKGSGSGSGHLMTKVIGTELMNGRHFYLVGETVWNNATQEDYEEALFSMSNMSVYDIEGNIRSEPFAFPLKDGATWTGMMDGVGDYNFSCKSFSGFKVDAGKFSGFKITATGSGGNYVFWYSPGVRYFVAVSYTAPDGAGEDDHSYELRLDAHGTTDSDMDGITAAGEKIIGTKSENKDTDRDGVVDGDDLNPLMDLRFTLELIHLTIEDKTDLLSDPDVYIWIQIVAGDEFVSDTTDTYRNQRDINLDLVYDIDIPDDGEPGPLEIGGVVNFWEQKEPAALGIALDVCGDTSEVDGFHFYFTYDIFMEEWSLYPMNPFWGSEAYMTGSGKTTVSGLDDGFSLIEERPVQDATLEFDMY